MTFLKQKSDSTLYFDKRGHKWQLSYHNSEPDFKNNLMNRLLAHSFYNPVIQTRLNWLHLGEYSLEELKSWVVKCINKDDDILTQFVSPDFLVAKIQRVGSIEELRNALIKYCFEADETTIPEELTE